MGRDRRTRSLIADPLDAVLLAAFAVALAAAALYAVDGLSILLGWL